MRHELKTHPEPFEALKSGVKRFEIRKDDRNYAVGDYLHLRKWEPEAKEYAAESALARVTYKVPGGKWGLAEDLCVLGVEVEWVRHDARLAPIVFLDIDGVLNSARSRQEFALRPQRYFDPKAVDALNQVMDGAHADIVVISSWRMGNLSWLKGLMKAAGVHGRVIGETPDLCAPRPSGLLVARCRGDEVQAWLDAQPVRPDRFVIFDDSEEFGQLTDRLVRTDYATGLGPEHVGPALAILGVER